MSKYLYQPLLRPAGFSTLPQGMDWDYVEAPSYVTKRPDLPLSKHPHGIISSSRHLSASDCERFDLRYLGSAE